MDAFAFVDLEMSGLEKSPNSKIIEFGVFVCNSDFSVLSKMCTTIRHDSLRFEPAAYDIHVKSGLIEDISTNKGMSVPEAESAAILLLKPYNTVYLAGSSVHIDRKFIHADMPALDSRFSHRHLDTASIRLFIKSVWGEKVLDHHKPHHRVEYDIADSIAEVKQFKSILTINPSTYFGDAVSFL